MSNVFKAKITVCGEETISLVNDNTEEIKLKQSDSIKNHIIGVDEYSKWFKIEGGSSKCKISKAVVKNMLGQKITDAPAYINE